MWIVTPLKPLEINLSENNLNWILLGKIIMVNDL